MSRPCAREDGRQVAEHVCRAQHATTPPRENGALGAPVLCPYHGKGKPATRLHAAREAGHPSPAPGAREESALRDVFMAGFKSRRAIRDSGNTEPRPSTFWRLGARGWTLENFRTLCKGHEECGTHNV